MHTASRNVSMEMGFYSISWWVSVCVCAQAQRVQSDRVRTVQWFSCVQMERCDGRDHYEMRQM